MRPFRVGFTSFLRLSRLPNAILPGLAIIAGAYAARAGAQTTFPAVIAFTLLHSVVTIWNDIRDEHVDRLNGIHSLGAIRHSRALPWLYVWMAVSLIAAAALGLLLPLRVDGLLTAFIALGWLYNDKPFEASRRPLASILILALSYGLIPFLIGTELTRLTWPVITLAAGWTAVRTSLSLLKDYKDAPGDAKAGKKTFLLVYGHSKVARASIWLAAIGYIICTNIVATYYARQPLFAAISLLAVGAWLVRERVRLLRIDDYAGLNQVFHSLLTYEIIFDGLVLLWLRSS